MWGDPREEFLCRSQEGATGTEPVHRGISSVRADGVPSFHRLVWGVGRAVVPPGSPASSGGGVGGLGKPLGLAF